MAQPRIHVPFDAGGFGGEQRSDGIIQGLVDNNKQITNAVGIARNSQGIQLTSLTYRSQNAEGTNFVVKVRTQDDIYLLLHIRQGLNGDVALVAQRATEPISCQM